MKKKSKNNVNAIHASELINSCTKYKRLGNIILTFSVSINLFIVLFICYSSYYNMDLIVQKDTFMDLFEFCLLLTLISIICDYKSYLFYKRTQKLKTSEFYFKG